MTKTMIFTFILNAGLCMSQNSQYTGAFLSNQSVKSECLFDYLTATEFILDEIHVYITAINSIGDTLWKTDPIVDFGMDYYRVKRPTIVNFCFQNNQRTDFQEVIWILYNNSQFGTVTKETGVFTFYGQD